MSEINLNIFIESLTHSLGENFLPFLGKLIWILLILITENLLGLKFYLSLIIIIRMVNKY